MNPNTIQRMLNKALAYAAANKDGYLADLVEYCAIPSISAQPEHHKDVLAAAQWMCDHFAKIGLKSRMLETAGNPCIYAEWLHPDKSKPTVLIYGHYDVQPAEPFELWDSAPFVPTVRDGKLFGRGTCDNKGQHMAHAKAVESYLRSEGSLPCSVKFIVEGEEEIGGPSLPAIIHSHAALLSCDAVMVSDGALLTLKQPNIEYGLRGMVGFELTVRTAAHDLHSGSYGGNIANPLMVLSQMMAQIKNDRGVITVPHFYDDVRILERDERLALSRVLVNEKTMIEETGASGVSGEPGFSVIERRGARPTFEINGMWGGYQGPGSKTVLPCEAHAKITCRLVPHQDPQKVYDAIATYLRSITPPHVALEISAFKGGARASLVDRSAAVFKAAAQAALETYGTEPVYTLEGGSIPVVNDFIDVLGKPVILLGLGLPDDALHAPNERFAVACYNKGTEVSIRFLDHVAKQG